MRISREIEDLDRLFDLDGQIELLREKLEADSFKKPHVWILRGKDCKGWKNVPDSGKYRWKYGSWKDYWEEYSPEEWPLQCRMKSCTDCAEDGAHIFQKNGKQYIIPMCAHFNRGRSDELFDVNAGTIAVAIDRKQTYRVK